MNNLVKNTILKLLLGFDDIEFDLSSSNSINQKVSNTIEDLKFILDNFVDLGLPSGTLWCKYNLGATCDENDSETWDGDYYSWGETKPKKSYTTTSYTYHDNPHYCLPAENDAASLANPLMKMPTMDQVDELIENTKIRFCSIDGVKDLLGFKCEGKNGNSIYFPATGFRSDEWSSGIKGYGSATAFWTCSIYQDDPTLAGYASIDLFKDHSIGFESEYNPRYNGYVIRPVCAK